MLVVLIMLWQYTNHVAGASDAGASDASHASFVVMMRESFP